MDDVKKSNSLEQLLESCLNKTTLITQIDAIISGKIFTPTWSDGVVCHLVMICSQVEENADLDMSVLIIRLLLHYLKRKMKGVSELAAIPIIFVKLAQGNALCEGQLPSYCNFHHYLDMLLTELLDNHVEDLKMALWNLADILLQIIVNSSSRIFCRQLYLNSLKKILSINNKWTRECFAENCWDLIQALPKCLGEVGDYTVQIDILEVIFRAVPTEKRMSLVPRWFGEMDCVVQSLFMRISKDFDMDGRKFLNAFNLSFGEDRLVFTFPCITASLGQLELCKPQKMGYSHFWVDFNMKTRSFQLICDVKDAQNPSQHESDVIVLWYQDIAEVILTKRMQVLTVAVTVLKIVGDIIENLPPSQQDLTTNSVTIEFEPGYPLEKVLVPLFGHKLQVMNLQPKNWVDPIPSHLSEAESMLMSSLTRKKVSESRPVFSCATDFVSNIPEFLTGKHRQVEAKDVQITEEDFFPSSYVESEHQTSHFIQTEILSPLTIVSESPIPRLSTSTTDATQFKASHVVCSVTLRNALYSDDEDIFERSELNANSSMQLENAILNLNQEDPSEIASSITSQPILSCQRGTTSIFPESPKYIPETQVTGQQLIGSTGMVQKLKPYLTSMRTLRAERFTSYVQPESHLSEIDRSLGQPEAHEMSVFPLSHETEFGPSLAAVQFIPSPCTSVGGQSLTTLSIASSASSIVTSLEPPMVRPSVGGQSLTTLSIASSASSIVTSLEPPMVRPSVASMCLVTGNVGSKMTLNGIPYVEILVESAEPPEMPSQDTFILNQAMDNLTNMDDVAVMNNLPSIIDNGEQTILMQVQNIIEKEQLSLVLSCNGEMILTHSTQGMETGTESSDNNDEIPSSLAAPTLSLFAPTTFSIEKPSLPTGNELQELNSEDTIIGTALVGIPPSPCGENDTSRPSTELEVLSNKVTCKTVLSEEISLFEMNCHDSIPEIEVDDAIVTDFPLLPDDEVNGENEDGSIQLAYKYSLQNNGHNHKALFCSKKSQKTPSKNILPASSMSSRQNQTKKKTTKGKSEFIKCATHSPVHSKDEVMMTSSSLKTAKRKLFDTSNSFLFEESPGDEQLDVSVSSSKKSTTNSVNFSSHRKSKQAKKQLEENVTLKPKPLREKGHWAQKLQELPSLKSKAWDNLVLLDSQGSEQKDPSIVEKRMTLYEFPDDPSDENDCNWLNNQPSKQTQRLSSRYRRSYKKRSCGDSLKFVKSGSGMVSLDNNSENIGHPTDQSTNAHSKKMAHSKDDFSSVVYSPKNNTAITIKENPTHKKCGRPPKGTKKITTSAPKRKQKHKPSKTAVQSFSSGKSRVHLLRNNLPSEDRNSFPHSMTEKPTRRVTRSMDNSSTHSMDNSSPGILLDTSKSSADSRGPNVAQAISLTATRKRKNSKLSQDNKSLTVFAEYLDDSIQKSRFSDYPVDNERGQDLENGQPHGKRSRCSVDEIQLKDAVVEGLANHTAKGTHSCVESRNAFRPESYPNPPFNSPNANVENELVNDIVTDDIVGTQSFNLVEDFHGSDAASHESGNSDKCLQSTVIKSTQSFNVADFYCSDAAKNVLGHSDRQHLQSSMFDDSSHHSRNSLISPMKCQRFAYLPETELSPTVPPEESFCPNGDISESKCTTPSSHHSVVARINLTDCSVNSVCNEEIFVTSQILRYPETDYSFFDEDSSDGSIPPQQIIQHPSSLLPTNVNSQELFPLQDSYQGIENSTVLPEHIECERMSYLPEVEPLPTVVSLEGNASKSVYPNGNKLNLKFKTRSMDSFYHEGNVGISKVSCHPKTNDDFFDENSSGKSTPLEHHISSVLPEDASSQELFTEWTVEHETEVIGAVPFSKPVSLVTQAPPCQSSFRINNYSFRESFRSKQNFPVPLDHDVNSVPLQTNVSNQKNESATVLENKAKSDIHGIATLSSLVDEVRKVKSVTSAPGYATPISGLDKNEFVTPHNLHNPRRLFQVGGANEQTMSIDPELFRYISSQLDAIIEVANGLKTSLITGFCNS